MACFIFTFNNAQNRGYRKSTFINFNFFWFIILSIGESNYELFLLMMNSFFGKFILIGFSWSMVFHILSGLRHLAWDLGYGFEIKTANISGVIVIIFSFVLTIIFWIFARGLI